MSRKHSKTKKVNQFIAGMIILIIGAALILTWWPETVVLFKGLAGIAVALSGMLLLYMASQE